MKFHKYCGRVRVVLDMLVLIPIFGISTKYIPTGQFPTTGECFPQPKELFLLSIFSFPRHQLITILVQLIEILVQRIAIPVQRIDIKVQLIAIPVQLIAIPVQIVAIPVQLIAIPVQLYDSKNEYFLWLSFHFKRQTWL